MLSDSKKKIIDQDKTRLRHELDNLDFMSQPSFKIIDQDKTRLRHEIKVVEFCGRQESISKEHDVSLIGRTPIFRGEHCQIVDPRIMCFP